MRKEQKKQEKDNKLYDFDFETEDDRKSKVKRKKADDKSASKKKKKTKKVIERNKVGQDSSKNKYDDEIIIGVTKYPEKKEVETKNKKEKAKIKAKEKEVKRRKNKKNIEQYNVNGKKKILK